MITLTYGDEFHAYGNDAHARAANGVIFPKDFTEFVKRMRKQHKFRYLACGELGTQKGRVHFHALLFWQEQPWTFKDKVFWWPEGGTPEKVVKSLGPQPEQDVWKYGYIYPEVIRSGAGCQYVTKYVQKGDGDLDHYLGQSRNIGTSWICEDWAQLHVDSGVAPKSPQYSFAEDRIMRTGRQWQYQMHKDVAIRFASAFANRWEVTYGDRPMPSNDWLDETLDKAYRKLPARAADNFFHKAHIPKPTQEQLPGHVRGFANVRFSNAHNCFYYLCPFEGRKVFWTKNAAGDLDWHHTVRGKSGFGESERAMHAMAEIPPEYKRIGTELYNVETGEITT